ncbi:cell division protein FtsQ/DivIB [Rickettsiales endosymbiont of Peranema trichophorum]|uniref:cell division protein FtsQ/DivIB n=1 Tax=Rickettsiales endosymbiont of Peranema trichophorum TaxID=2486577 RepID=UPI001A91B989|nr:FtsQ-type POTRA domain-containing protein [Rickettsiales endosymbiont of Peranema trichophorum]
MKIQGYVPKSQQVLVQIRKKHHKRYILPIILGLAVCCVMVYLCRDALKIWNSGAKIVTKMIATSMTPTLRTIQVSGNKRLSQDDIIKLSGLYDGANILTLDLEGIRADIKSNSWISEVSVRRIFPDTVQITVEESIVNALWYHNNQYHFVDNKGQVITQVDTKDISNIKEEYVVLLGDNACDTYASLNALLVEHTIDQTVKALERVGNRRWNVHLKTGTIVKLPEDNGSGILSKSIQTLSKILAGKTLDYAIIDLRLMPDKIYINK